MAKAKIKIKKMAKAETALVGMTVPNNCSDVGKLVEDKLEELGYLMNRGKGIDIPGLGVEVKTRKEDATSARQIGTMTFDDILKTPYRLSPIKTKFQQQLIVKHKNNVVTSAKVYDFSNPHIQALIEHAYEECRVELAKHSSTKDTVMPKYVRGTECVAYWEYHQSNSFQFRIAGSVYSKLERMAVNCDNNLFEYGP